jgi:hypothetical protein
MKRTSARTRPTRVFGALALTTALALSGCSTTADDGDAAATPSGAETAGSSVSPTGGTEDDGGTSAPPFLAGTETSTAEPGSPGAVALLTDIRLGSHDGFDRVVLEYDGGVPGWEVGYVDEAVSDGKGDVIEVDGGSILQVRTMGVRYPEESDTNAFRGDPGPIRLRVGATPEVTEVVYDHVFEGYGMTFVGIDESEPRPFRVYRLDSPTRIVIEIEHR